MPSWTVVERDPSGLLMHTVGPFRSFERAQTAASRLRAACPGWRYDVERLHTVEDVLTLARYRTA